MSEKGRKEALGISLLHPRMVSLVGENEGVWRGGVMFLAQVQPLDKFSGELPLDVAGAGADELVGISQHIAIIQQSLKSTGLNGVIRG